MASFGVTENGFILKTFDDIVSDLETKMKSRVGEDWYLDQYTPEGAILYIVASVEAENWIGLKADYDANYIDLSEGIQLDYKGKEENTPRSQGNYSNTVLEFTTEKELTIPLGTLVKKKDTDLLFKTTTTLVIDETFVGEVSAVSTNTGSDYNSAIGQINELSTGIIGVVSVSNTEPATGGEGIESDISYRKRIKLAKSSKGGSTVDSITSELLKLSTVNNALVLENITDTVDENGINPGELKIFIDGISSSAISETIHTYKSEGIATVGSESYEVTNVSGQNITEKFSLFEKKQLYIKITVDSITGELTDKMITDIKDNIISYVEDIQEGGQEDLVGEIIINQLSSQAYRTSDNLKKVTTLASLTSPASGTVDITIPVGEYFYCDETTVEVITSV